MIAASRPKEHAAGRRDQRQRREERGVRQQCGRDAIAQREWPHGQRAPDVRDLPLEYAALEREQSPEYLHRPVGIEIIPSARDDVVVPSMHREGRPQRREGQDDRRPQGHESEQRPPTTMIFVAIATEAPAEEVREDRRRVVQFHLLEIERQYEQRAAEYLIREI